MKVPSVEVKADRNVFSVNVDTPENIWGNDSYELSIHANGDIVLNDNIFSSRDTAISVLKSITAFLEKQKK
jgi:hypothetical protein